MPPEWQEIVPEQKLTFPLSDEDRKNGYLLFKKHYMEDTTPYTVPRQHELLQKLQIFAVPGEYEPVVFGLYSLRPLKDIRAEVSTLRSSDGQEIAAENIELRSAVPLPFLNPAQSKKFAMRNEVLVKREKNALDQERMLLYWITIFVPENTPEGRYSGNVTVTVDGHKQQIPLLLRVFPVKLETDGQIERGLYIGRHQTDPAMREKFYVDMREHGMNTMAPSNFSVFPDWKDGKIQLHFEALDLEMELYRKAGFNCPVTIDMRPVQAWLINLQEAMENYKKQGKNFPDNFSIEVPSFDVSPKFTEFEANEYKKIVKAMVEHARIKNYPQLYFLPQEEATNKGVRLQQLERFSKLLKESGVTVTGWSNAPWGGLDDLQEQDPSIDVRYYNYVTPEIIAQTQKSEDIFAIYNHGDRLMYGFFGEKVKAAGMLQWAYIWSETKGMLSGGRGTYNEGMVYMAPDGPLPSPLWERLREGVDDARFIHTLKTLIAQNSQSADAAVRDRAAKAQQELDSILEKLPDTTPGINEFAQTLDPMQLDVWRFKLIRQIMALQKDQAETKQEVSAAALPQTNGTLIGGVTPLSAEQAEHSLAAQSRSSLVIPFVEKADFNAEMKGASWEKAVTTSPFLLTGEHAWIKARAFSNQAIGKVDKTPATQTTTAKLFYDSQAIYIGFLCRESQMSRIVAQATRRDGAVWSDDAVEIFIKPLLNSGRYYQIATNTKGILADSEWIWQGAKTAGAPWDPEIEVKTSVGADSWQAVFRIPFAAFGLESCPAEGSLWQANLGREEQPVPGCEYSTWAFVEGSFHEINLWGNWYFNRIPEAIISNIASPAPAIGKNKLQVVLQNNLAHSFEGTMAVELEGAGKAPAEVPVRLDGKSGIIEIPYEVAKPGKLNLDLKLLSAEKKLIFGVLCNYDVPVPLQLQLMSSEVAGGKLAARLMVNISNATLSHDRIICRVEGEKQTVSGEIKLTERGGYLVMFNTESLVPGRYCLKVVLQNNAGENIAEETGAFEVLEQIF